MRTVSLFARDGDANNILFGAVTAPGPLALAVLKD